MDCTKMNGKTLLIGSIFITGCVCLAILCLAAPANAQFSAYDSDANSDSDGGPIITNSELNKLMRNSARRSANPASSGQQHSRNLQHQNYQQQGMAATRNLYNNQQPLQYAPTQHRRQFDQAQLSGFYNPLSGAASSSGAHSAANNDDDDDDSPRGASYGSNFGPNFDANDASSGSDGDEDSRAQPMNLNQAASGYPGTHGDYSEAAGYGYGADGSDFGPPEGFGMGDGRRAKAASSLMGSRGADGEDAGAPLYGPNSAINAGEVDDEGRSGYAPESSNENGDDDE